MPFHQRDFDGKQFSNLKKEAHTEKSSKMKDIVLIPTTVVLVRKDRTIKTALDAGALKEQLRLKFRLLIGRI